jgi:uncharacterized protein YggE
MEVRIMTKALLLVLIIGAAASNVGAQEAGASVYGKNQRKTSGVPLGSLTSIDPKDSVAAHYVEANVLMNVRAVRYVAVFGLAQEGATVVAANQKIDLQLKDFTTALEGLGVTSDNLFVDFVAQNRVYDYSGTSSTVTERLSGFEVKKNVAVRYSDKTLLGKMLAAASKAGIFDLIKVDYEVGDMNAVRTGLMDEAARIIKKKEESYGRLLNIKLRPQAVFQETYNVFFPSEMYASYTAFESGKVVDTRYNTNVLQKRKATTFYFNPLSVAEFDLVIGAKEIEPVVQCTLYLKVKYTAVQ